MFDVRPGSSTAAFTASICLYYNTSSVINRLHARAKVGVLFDARPGSSTAAFTASICLYYNASSVLNGLHARAKAGVSPPRRSPPCSRCMFKICTSVLCVQTRRISHDSGKERDHSHRARWYVVN